MRTRLDLSAIRSDTSVCMDTALLPMIMMPSPIASAQTSVPGTLGAILFEKGVLLYGERIKGCLRMKNKDPYV